MKKGKIQILSTKFQKSVVYAAIILVVLMTISIVKNVNRILEIKSELEKETVKVEKIKLENEDLERQASEVNRVEFIEKELRNKLGLAREGEVVVVLPEEEILRKLAPKIYEEEDSLPDPNWKKWLKLFFVI